MEIEIKPVTPDIRFSQNFSYAKLPDSSSKGWSDIYIYILAGIGLGAIVIGTYLFVENSKYYTNKIAEKKVGKF